MQRKSCSAVVEVRGAVPAERDCDLLEWWEPCGQCRSGYDEGDAVFICIGGLRHIAVSLVNDNRSNPVNSMTGTTRKWDVYSFKEFLSGLSHGNPSNQSILG